MSRVTDWIDMHTELTCQGCGVIFGIVLVMIGIVVWYQWKAQQRFDQIREGKRYE